MSLSIILLCFTAGVILVLIEALVPGGIAGFLGGVLLLGGLGAVFVEYGAFHGAVLAGILLTAAGFGTYVWFHYLPKTKLGAGLLVGENFKGYVSYSPENAGLLGECGRALTVLRPAGRALIAGRKYDVVSSGEHVAAGAAVRVCQVEGNRIVVESVSGPEAV